MFDPLVRWHCAVTLAVLLLSLAPPSHGTPINNSITSPNLTRRINTSNLDILTPDSSGNLVRSALSITSQQPVPGDVTYIGTGQCKSSTFYLSTLSCTLFCTTQTVVVAAQPVKASADIVCTTNTCGIALSQSVTVSDSTTVSGSFSAGAGNTIKGQAQLGGSRTWSNSATASNTYTFSPTNGDVGYIIFVPYMLEACGTFTEFHWDLFCHDWNYNYDSWVQPIHFDPMSCGQTPLTLQGGNADGAYSFCNTNTGVGCG
ncbi:hypothetical protein BKA64DRAFT_705814 [Cadophora sp. MPI-SDFR-AT-0126]|nr:hypothetical protein BKA64DRAFT_705814 [Leotiomycetes sp. MPI-SDFR-AT-0126]